MSSASELETHLEKFIYVYYPFLSDEIQVSYEIYTYFYLIPLCILIPKDREMSIFAVFLNIKNQHLDIWVYLGYYINCASSLT